MLPETPKYRRRNLDDGNPRVYIKRGNLGQRAPRKFLPLGRRLEGEINLHSSTISKEEGAKGRGLGRGRRRRRHLLHLLRDAPLHQQLSLSLSLTMSMCE